MGKAEDTVEELVVMIKRGVLRLPEMQRRYVWQNCKLDHDFYEVETLPENDRLRYTISPAARKEILRRRLALNHERAKAEQAAQAAASHAQKPHGHRAKPSGGGTSAGLFLGEEDSRVRN